jgi:Domain of unknown function (DUF4062)
LSIIGFELAGRRRHRLSNDVDQWSRAGREHPHARQTVTSLREDRFVTLHIDTAGAAAKPSAADLARWASEQRVFVSSVMAELAAERRAAAQAISRLGAEPVCFETFGGRDDDPQAAYLGEVASSTVYLGILARTYGRLLPSRLSATHEEYREAEHRGLRISVWVAANEDFQGDQATFVDEVRQFHTTGAFADPADLAAAITVRLTRIAAEDLSPWCKLGDNIFRTHTITDEGHRLTVRANISDAAVLASLEGLRPGAWAGKHETRVTYAGRSYAVRVATVTSIITSTRASGVEINLDRAPDREPGGMTFSVSFDANTYTGDDITELNLRHALFGETLPRGLLTFRRDINDPLSQLQGTALPVEIHRAVADLLITETLIGSGRASRVARVQLAPAAPHGRRLVVEWAGRTDRNTPTGLRSIDGYLTN